MFAKRRKIDGTSIQQRISTQPSDNFVFFPLSEATLIRFGSPRGGSGASWAALSAPRRILGASWASPGAPLGRSRGAPGTLRGAPGTPLGRTGCPEVDIGCPEYLAGPIFGRFWHRLWRGIPRDFGLTFATGGQGLAATPRRKESLWLARRGCHGRSNQRWRLAQKNRLAYRRSEHRSYCHVVLQSYWTCLESSLVIIIRRAIGPVAC